MNKPNAALIDTAEFNNKILDYISSDELDKMINCTVFKDNPQSKSAIIHGMCIAAMLTSQCDLVYAIKTVVEEPKKEGDNHAHWVNAYPDIEPNPMFMYGICSKCGFTQSMSDSLKYCPNCGREMIEEKMSYEELLADRDDYKKRFKQAIDLIHKLKNRFLGEGYYVTDSCGEPQASEVIIDEILNKFAPNPKEPTKNWIFNRFWQR